MVLQEAFPTTIAWRWHCFTKHFNQRKQKGRWKERQKEQPKEGKKESGPLSAHRGHSHCLAPAAAGICWDNRGCWWTPPGLSRLDVGRRCQWSHIAAYIGSPAGQGPGRTQRKALCHRHIQRYVTRPEDYIPWWSRVDVLASLGTVKFYVHHRLISLRGPIFSGGVAPSFRRRLLKCKAAPEISLLSIIWYKNNLCLNPDELTWQKCDLSFSWSTQTSGLWFYSGSTGLMWKKGQYLWMKTDFLVLNGNMFIHSKKHSDKKKPWAIFFAFGFLLPMINKSLLSLKPDSENVDAEALQMDFHSCSRHADSCRPLINIKLDKEKKTRTSPVDMKCYKMVWKGSRIAHCYPHVCALRSSAVRESALRTADGRSRGPPVLSCGR